MPLDILNAGTSWTKSPLIPTTGQLDPSAGNAQSFASSLILASHASAWSITLQIAQPKIAAQRGAGGAIQDSAARLIVTGSGTSWALLSRVFAADFAFVISPDGFSVLFTSTTGDAPELLSWDFGDGNAGAGPAPAHIYENFGAFVVVLTAKRSRGFENANLLSSKSRTVTLLATAQPDESLDDVLNLELGFHAYEPARTQAGDAGENVSHFNQVLNLPTGQTATLLFFTPAQSIRVRQVTATGTGDGLFRLYLNGQVIDTKRSYSTGRNVRFDMEEGLKLTINDTLEIKVTNASTLTQSFDGALLGRTL